MTFQKINDCLYNICYDSFAHCNPWQANVETCPRRGLVFSPGVTFLFNVSGRCVPNFHNSLFCDNIETYRVISKSTSKLYCS